MVCHSHLNTVLYLHIAAKSQDPVFDSIVHGDAPIRNLLFMLLHTDFILSLRNLAPLVSIVVVLFHKLSTPIISASFFLTLTLLSSHFFSYEHQDLTTYNCLNFLSSHFCLVFCTIFLPLTPTNSFYLSVLDGISFGKCLPFF